jgi:hypothetical protein
MVCMDDSYLDGLYALRGYQKDTAPVRPVLELFTHPSSLSTPFLPLLVIYVGDSVLPSHWYLI